MSFQSPYHHMLNDNMPTYGIPCPEGPVQFGSGLNTADWLLRQTDFDLITRQLVVQQQQQPIDQYPEFSEAHMEQWMDDEYPECRMPNQSLPPLHRIPAVYPASRALPGITGPVVPGALASYDAATAAPPAPVSPATSCSTLRQSSGEEQPAKYQRRARKEQVRTARAAVNSCKADKPKKLSKNGKPLGRPSKERLAERQATEAALPFGGIKGTLAFAVGDI